jgi:hypothetical protein
MMNEDTSDSNPDERALEDEARRLREKAHEEKKVAHIEEEDARRERERAHEDEEEARRIEERLRQQKELIPINVVVGGGAVTIEAHPAEHLAAVRDKALKKAEIVGQPPENYEIKTIGGVVLDPQSTVQSVGLKAGDEIFLSLKIGVLGV